MNNEENEDYMLSTFDNPFNPFDDFVTWWKYDYFVLGHDTCGLLAREAGTSSVFSDELNEQLIDEAVERIIKRNRIIFKKVYRSDFEKKRETVKSA